MILAKVNLGRILSLIRRAPDIARPVMMKFMHDSARTLISSSGKVPGLVQVTPPHSEGMKGSKAKQQGEKAVTAGVWQVYAGPSKVYELIKAKAGPGPAAGFWKAVKQKNWSQADQIMRRVLGQNLDAFDDGAAHAKRRNRRGRVRGGSRPSLFVRDTKPVRGFIARKKRNVGLLAASIPAAYNGRFGPLNGIPAWISRHQSSWGKGFVMERESRRGGLLITIKVNAGVLNQEMQRRFNYVLGYRIRAMQRQLPYIARHIEQKLAAQLANA